MVKLFHKDESILLHSLLYTFVHTFAYEHICVQNRHVRNITFYV